MERELEIKEVFPQTVIKDLKKQLQTDIDLSFPPGEAEAEDCRLGDIAATTLGPGQRIPLRWPTIPSESICHIPGDTWGCFGAWRAERSNA